MVICPICVKPFLSESRFENHHRKYHTIVNSADGNLLSKPAKMSCSLCGKLFANAGTLDTHIKKQHSVSSCSIVDLAELPFFNEININSALIDVPRFDRYLDNIKQLKDQHPNNMVILHINICSIMTKFQFVEAILNTKNVDVLFVSETFLDEHTPESKFKNIHYNMPLRRDRTKHGGGLLVYVRKGYVVEEIERSA